MARRPASGGSQAEPPEFCCPISDTLMLDPVVLVHTGQTYDRKSIQDWFSRGETTCPLTGAELPSIQLTPNYALKALIQQWKEKDGMPSSSAAQPGTHYPDLQGSMYPDLADDGQPRDKVTQVRAALAKLRAAQHRPQAQREQTVYELWTLSELAADEACYAELLRQSGVPLALGFLSEGNSLGCQTAVAQLLQRVAGQDGVFAAAHGAGSIAPLVAMLSRQEAAKSGEVSCRVAAAAALRELAATSSQAQAEVLFQLCAWSTQQGQNRAAPSQPSLIAPLALMLQNPPTSEGAVAASLLAKVTQGRPVQEYARYSSCAGTAAVPSLVALLQETSAAPDARAALRALLYTPNQAAVLAELVQALPHPDHMFLGIRPAAREAAGMFLWELAAENVNLVGVLGQVAGLPGALEQALRTRSLAGAGLVQLVTCDHARPSNSVVTPPNTDAIRLQLVAYEQVVPALVQLLYSDDQTAVQAAAHALANLTAFRSSAAPESRFPGLRRNSGGFARHPASMVAEADACARLAALLACPAAAVAGPSIALLANLCADNETRDRVRQSRFTERTAPAAAVTVVSPVGSRNCWVGQRYLLGVQVRDAAKDYGWEHFRQRLEQLCGWTQLPDKCRAAARTSLQRLLAGKLERAPAQYSLVTLLMWPPALEA